EAANGLEILSAAGLKSKESITALPTVLNLATAAGLGLADSASLVVATLTQFKRPIEDASIAADVLARASTLTDTTISELGAALSYAGSEANTNGLSLEQTAAAIDILAGSALKGERAGTSLQNILANLNDPASKLRVALRAAGIDTGNMAEAFDQLSRKSGPEVQRVLLSVDREARGAARALIEGADKAAGFTDALKNSSGTAKTMAEIMGDNLRGSLKSLQSAWDSVGRFIVDQNFLDILRGGVDDVTAAFRRAVSDGSLEGFRDSLRTMVSSGIDSIRRFVAEFDFKAALTSLSSFINSAVSFVSNLSSATVIAADVMKAAWFGFRGAVEAVAASVSGAIAFVLTGLNKLVQGMNTIGLVSDQAAASFENFTTAFTDAAAEYKRAADESFSKAADALSSSATRMGAALETTTEKTAELSSGMDQAAGSIETAAEALQDRASDIADAAGEMAGSFDEIARASDSSASSIQLAFIAALDGIKTPDELDTLQTTLSDVERSTADAGRSTDAFVVLQALAAAKAKELAQEQEKTAAAIKATVAPVQTLSAEQKTNLALWEQQLQAGRLTQAQFDAMRATLLQTGGALSTATEQAGTLDSELAETGETANETAAAIGGITAAFDGSAQSVADVANQLETARDATDQAAASGRSHAEATDEVAASTSRATGTVKVMSDSLRDAVVHAQAARDSMGEIGTEGTPEFQRLNQEVESFFGNLQLIDDYGRSPRAATALFRDWITDIVRIRDVTEAASDAIITMGDDTASAAAQQRALAVATQLTANHAHDLGSETLDALRAAISSANREMDSLRESAKDTLESLQEKLLEIRDDEAALLTLRYERERLEITKQLAIARSAGDREAIAALEKSLALLKEINKEEQKRLKDKEKEEEDDDDASDSPAPVKLPEDESLANDRDGNDIDDRIDSKLEALQYALAEGASLSAIGTLASRASSSILAYQSTVRIKLNVGDQEIELNGTQKSAQALIAALKAARAVA
ncbi:MAG: phage tail tape measure protein, partial [Candidatus Competibacteraceae bacterium]|nr:phage tail tape measure protein [Candidatus Competibacteraceae bacterium]